MTAPDDGTQLVTAYRRTRDVLRARWRDLGRAFRSLWPEHYPLRRERLVAEDLVDACPVFEDWLARQSDDTLSGIVEMDRDAGTQRLTRARLLAYADGA